MPPAVRDVLVEVARELELRSPVEEPRGWVCAGTLCDIPAELVVGPRGNRTIALTAHVKGLPEGIGIQPRPTGPGSQEIILGRALPSGDDDFDLHYMLFGAPEIVGASPRVAPALLEWLADSYNPHLRVTARSDAGIWFDGGEPTITPTDPNGMRWTAAPDVILGFWHAADRVVSRGLQLGVVIE
jgi:hypothetical protein